MCILSIAGEGERQKSHLDLYFGAQEKAWNRLVYRNSTHLQVCEPASRHCFSVEMLNTNDKQTRN